MDIRNADNITRRATVPEGDRTPERSRCADWLQDHVVDAGRWPMQFTDIKQLADERLNGDSWSRQHIANTLRTYFEPDREGPHLDDLAADELKEAYRMGYRDGYQDGFSDGKNS